jgi:hypothetical protein
MRGVFSISEKMVNMAYAAIPQEIKPSGWILPGTLVGQAGPYPCIATAPVLLFNFPHVHALPDLRHTHEVRVPDLDCSADSAQEVRGKQSGVAGAAPLHKQSTSGIGILTGLFAAIGSVLAATRSMTQNNLFSKKYGG